MVLNVVVYEPISRLYYSSLQPDEGGGPHVAHHRQQRGRNSGEEHSLPDVGHWRTGVSEVLLEHLLLQHRGEGHRWTPFNIVALEASEALSGW